VTRLFTDDEVRRGEEEKGEKGEQRKEKQKEKRRSN
jgi:hypothetical protein